MQAIDVANEENKIPIVCNRNIDLCKSFAFICEISNTPHQISDTPLESDGIAIIGV